MAAPLKVMGARNRVDGVLNKFSSEVASVEGVNTLKISQDEMRITAGSREIGYRGSENGSIGLNICQYDIMRQWNPTTIDFLSPGGSKDVSSFLILAYMGHLELTKSEMGDRTVSGG